MSRLSREFLLRECNAFAERLVAAGDMESFKDAFGSSDPNYEIEVLETSDLKTIYDEYISPDNK